MVAGSSSCLAEACEPVAESLPPGGDSLPQHAGNVRLVHSVMRRSNFTCLVFGSSVEILVLCAAASTHFESNRIRPPLSGQTSGAQMPSAPSSAQIFESLFAVSVVGAGPKVR